MAGECKVCGYSKPGAAQNLRRKFLNDAWKVGFDGDEYDLCLDAYEGCYIEIRDILPESYGIGVEISLYRMYENRRRKPVSRTETNVRREDILGVVNEFLSIAATIRDENVNGLKYCGYSQRI